MTDPALIEMMARAIEPGAWQLADHRLTRLGARNDAERAEDVAEIMASPRIVKSLESARAARAAHDAWLRSAGMAVVKVELLARIDDWLNHVDLTGTGRHPTRKVARQFQKDREAVSAMLAATGEK